MHLHGCCLCCFLLNAVQMYCIYLYWKRMQDIGMWVAHLLRNYISRCFIYAWVLHVSSAVITCLKHKTRTTVGIKFFIPQHISYITTSRLWTSVYSELSCVSAICSADERPNQLMFALNQNVFYIERDFKVFSTSI